MPPSLSFTVCTLHSQEMKQKVIVFFITQHVVEFHYHLLTETLDEGSGTVVYSWFTVHCKQQSISSAVYWCVHSRHAIYTVCCCVHSRHAINAVCCCVHSRHAIYTVCWCAFIHIRVFHDGVVVSSACSNQQTVAIATMCCIH